MVNEAWIPPRMGGVVGGRPPHPRNRAYKRAYQPESLVVSVSEGKVVVGFVVDGDEEAYSLSFQQVEEIIPSLMDALTQAYLQKQAKSGL